MLEGRLRLLIGWFSVLLEVNCCFVCFSFEELMLCVGCYGVIGYGWNGVNW